MNQAQRLDTRTPFYGKVEQVRRLQELKIQASYIF